MYVDRARSRATRPSMGAPVLKASSTFSQGAFSDLQGGPAFPTPLASPGRSLQRGRRVLQAAGPCIYVVPISQSNTLDFRGPLANPQAFLARAAKPAQPGGSIRSGSLTGREIDPSQIALRDERRAAVVRRDHADNLAGPGNQRRRLHRERLRFEHNLARGTVVDIAFSDIANDNATTLRQRGTASGVSVVDLTKEIDERLVEAQLARNSQHLAVQKLNIALLCRGDVRATDRMSASSLVTSCASTRRVLSSCTRVIAFRSRLSC